MGWKLLCVALEMTAGKRRCSSPPDGPPCLVLSNGKCAVACGWRQENQQWVGFVVWEGMVLPHQSLGQRSQRVF